VKMQRLHAVEQLEAEISGRINRALVGREAEVLVEGSKPATGATEPSILDPRPATPDPRPARMWHGRTRQNKLVHFPGPAAIGELATVRIERASPWALVGNMVG